MRRHTQIDLPLPKKHGGKRRGAGRPPKNPRQPSERHRRRDRFEKPQSLHVTLRVTGAVGRLRRRDAYHAIRRAMVTVLDRTDFRIVHVSLERAHIHLIVEADNNVALADGMQAFEISAARRLNRLVARPGNVFTDRYHARRISSPTQARNAIRYVVNNWRHHREDRKHDTRGWHVDYYSSGPSFTGWTEYEQSSCPFTVFSEYEPLPVSEPQTWLLAKGWRRAGPISLSDVPGND